MAVKEISPVKEKEQHLLDEMFKTYKALDVTCPSSYILSTYEYDKVKTDFCAACHAGMPRIGAGMDQLITAVPNSSATDIKFLRWLIEGPFRCMSDKISLEQDKTSGLYYLRCIDMDKWPAKLIANFCIASRMPIEFQADTKQWYKFVDVGVDPSLAFLLSHNSYRNDIPKDLWTYKVWDQRGYAPPKAGHRFIDHQTSWSKIIKGTPDVSLDPSRSYKKCPGDCFPTNVIWRGEEQEFNRLVGKTAKELMEVFSLEPKVIVEPTSTKRKKQIDALNGAYEAMMAVNDPPQVGALGQWNQEQGAAPPQPGQIIPNNPNFPQWPINFGHQPQPPMHQIPDIDDDDDDDIFEEDEFDENDDF